VASESPASILPRVEAALAARSEALDSRAVGALRLFNGFLEGCPELVIDLYGDTLVFFDYTDPAAASQVPVMDILEFLRPRLPAARAGILKIRRSPNPASRRGASIWGDQPARRICEHGVWYAIDLLLNQDASFYLDTRLLRKWAIDNLEGKDVLNMFAYTGSLGVAAQAGGAARVVQVDLNRTFLNLAKESCLLNGLPVHKPDFIAGDFFPVASRLRRAEVQFDCAFLDPPFFSLTSKGRVNLLTHSQRLINKIRPLIADGGWLVAINNALYVSGADYLRSLETLCADGYLTIETLISVPSDVAGYTQTAVSLLPADPAPFNHATKIAVLRGRRKS
jgi:23S rRNA (cytosine1962-C5)-methyltransferase